MFARASAIASAICASAFKYLRLKSTVSAIHAGSVGIDRCLARRLSIAQRYHARPGGQVSTAGLARRHSVPESAAMGAMFRALREEGPGARDATWGSRCGERHCIRVVVLRARRLPEAIRSTPLRYRARGY